MPRFNDKNGSELVIKNTISPTCCLRITDPEDQAYFIIKPDQADEIIAAIREQLKEPDDAKKDTK